MDYKKVSDRVGRFIGEKALFTPNDHLIAAISGGPDSMAMLFLLNEMGFDLSIAHCNFSLRGPDSDAEEDFVREWGAQLDIPVHVKTFDTLEFAHDKAISIQEAARKLRYAWFEELRQQQSAQCILTGHHMQDSLETSLINLLRGSGIRGISGIPPAKGNIRRPMLCMTKSEIDAFVAEENIPYMTDQSNFSTQYLRNRIRMHVLPPLEQSIPGLFSKYNRSMAQLGRESALMDEIMASLTSENVIDKSGWISIHNKVSAHPYGDLLLYYLLRPYGFTWDQCTKLHRKRMKTGSQVYSMTHILLQDRDALILKNINDKQKVCIKLHGEGTYPTPLGKMHLKRTAMGQIQFTKQNDRVCMDPAKVEWPLVLRHWKPGDTFCPFGMEGKKQKIQDLLTNLKLSGFEKEKVLVCTSGGKICWVVGFRLDERFKIDATTQEILVAEWDAET